MLWLAGTDFPKTTEAFRRALDEGFKILSAPKGVVEISGEFPNLTLLKIDLSGARVGEKVEPPLGGRRDPSPGPSIARIEISASPLRVFDAPVNLHGAADGVRCDFARDERGRLVLAPASVRDGSFEVQIRREDLQKLVCCAASAAASKHGAKIEDAEISLTSLGPRALGFDAKISASMFVSATVRVQGWVEIDDELNAKFSRLTCEAGGMIGAMAAGFIRPQLEKLQARPISLRALPFGDLNLRDLKIDAGDPLRLHARFSGA